VLPRSPEVLLDERKELIKRLLGCRGGQIFRQKPFAFPFKHRQLDLAAGLAVLLDKLVKVRAGVRRFVGA
jgi:hypothetical protein